MHTAVPFSAHMKSVLFGLTGKLASINVLRSSFITWAFGKEWVCFWFWLVLFLFHFLRLLTDLFFSLLFFEPWQGLHGRHKRSLAATLQHIKKSKTVSTSTASLPRVDKINKNVLDRLLRKRGFKLTDALLHRPGLVIDVSWHAKSQTCGASSHRDTAGSSVHKSSGCKGSGDPRRRTRSRIAQEPRQRRHRMPNLRPIALNPTEIKPLQFGTERSRTDVSPAPQQAPIYADGSGCASPGCPDRDVVACQISAR